MKFKKIMLVALLIGATANAMAGMAPVKKIAIVTRIQNMAVPYMAAKNAHLTRAVAAPLFSTISNAGSPFLGAELMQLNPEQALERVKKSNTLDKFYWADGPLTFEELKANNLLPAKAYDDIAAMLAKPVWSDDDLASLGRYFPSAYRVYQLFQKMPKAAQARMTLQKNFQRRWDAANIQPVSVSIHLWRYIDVDEIDELTFAPNKIYLSTASDAPLNTLDSEVAKKFSDQMSKFN